MEQQPQSVLGGAPAAPAAAPAGAPAPKKSNAGLIVAIIVAALILIGGAVAAVLIIVNSNNGKKDDETSKQESKKDDDKKDDDKSDDDEDEEDEDKQDEDEDEDEDEDSGKVATDKPYTKKDAYFINISGKKYNFNNTISEVEKSGYKLNSQAKDKTVPVNSYLILIGASRLTDSNSNGFGFTAYNDGDEKVTVPNAKLGGITISKGYTDDAKATVKKFSVYGGIKIGSTLAQLKAAFGEPTTKTDSTYGDTYEYKDNLYKKYSFKVKDGVVDEISWTCYGKLADR